MFVHESDEKIREWVKNNLFKKVKNVKFYQERFTRFDGEYIDKSGNTRYIEVKNRHFNHDRYKTTDIEKDKYLEMTDAKCDLIICFDDGVLYYTPEDIVKELDGFKNHLAPDQKDALKNIWDKHIKKFACFTVNENRFFPYSKFNSAPTREITPSQYNN